MIALVFVDTNVLVYTLDNRYPQKQTAAALETAQNAAAIAQQNLGNAQMDLTRQNQQLQAAMAQTHRRQRY